MLHKPIGRDLDDAIIGILARNGDWIASTQIQAELLSTTTHYSNIGTVRNHLNQLLIEGQVELNNEKSVAYWKVPGTTAQLSEKLCVYQGRSNGKCLLKISQHHRKKCTILAGMTCNHRVGEINV